MNTRIAVKENYDEDDLSDDVDDEVFVRDGKKGILKIDKQKGDERPLMPPRRKSKQKANTSNPEVCSRQPCNIYNCLLPVYFGIATIISIAFLMLLYIFFVDKLPLLMNKFDLWTSHNNYNRSTIDESCLDLKLKKIWVQRIPKLTSNSQIELLDVNKDNVEDIIIGIGTELDDIYYEGQLCRELFNSPEDQCSGGVVALDGVTGEIIWNRWLRRLVLSVQCDFEITGDFVSDCIVTGKGGLLVALSGTDGTIMWELETPKKDHYINLYNVLIIHDVDADNCMDLLASHTFGDDVLQSHLIVVSGHAGKQLQRIPVTPNEPILHAPQILTDFDGGEIVLFITGDPYHSGGIYSIPIYDLLKGDTTRIRNIYHHKTGILAPPIIADMNLDGLHDIVYVADSTVFVIDGSTYLKKWNVSLYNFVSSAFQITTVSSVTPSYFNNDMIPDLMVSFAVGSDYPEYYYSMTLVLDGQNGNLLLKEPLIRSSVPDTVGAITLSNNDLGHDAFIYWTAVCEGKRSTKEPFSFPPQENRAFWADLCGIRFNSTLILELYALTKDVNPPGILLYSAKSHIKDVSNILDFDLVKNYMEKRQRVTKFFVKPRSKNEPSSMEQMPPMETDNSVDDKPYGPENDNDWRPEKNGDQNYDGNENLGDANTDYITDREYDPMNNRNENNYRYVRSIQQSQSVKNTMLPKVSASGIISKSFDGDNLDLILVHYEVRADDSIQVVVGKNEECIQNGLALSSIPSSKYHGLPREQLKEQLFRDCSEHRPIFRNPLNNAKQKFYSLQMENLYITRNRIACSCQYDHEEKKGCDSLAPYEKQSYPTYLGKDGNSAYKSRIPRDDTSYYN